LILAQCRHAAAYVNSLGAVLDISGGGSHSLGAHSFLIFGDSNGRSHRPGGAR
jgi:hypothetical protein